MQSQKKGYITLLLIENCKKKFSVKVKTSANPNKKGDFTLLRLETFKIFVALLSKSAPNGDTYGYFWDLKILEKKKSEISIIDLYSFILSRPDIRTESFYFPDIMKPTEA